MKGNKPLNGERIIQGVLWALMLFSICFAVRGGVRMASSGQVETAAKGPVWSLMPGTEGQIRVKLV